MTDLLIKKNLSLTKILTKATRTFKDSEKNAPPTEKEQTPNQDQKDQNKTDEKDNPYANAPKVDPTEYHEKAIQVVAEPNDVAILVNKQYRLPDQYIDYLISMSPMI